MTQAPAGLYSVNPTTKPGRPIARAVKSSGPDSYPELDRGANPAELTCSRGVSTALEAAPGIAKSLRSLLSRSFGRAVFYWAASVLVLVVLGFPSKMTFQDIPQAPRAAVLPSACWSGPEPLSMGAAIPGHVAVEVHGRVVVRGQHATAMALDQIFNGHDHGIHVLGFCP